MNKPRSERSRWVTVFTIPRPSDTARSEVAIGQHERALAVVEAFAAVGRVVRVEPAKFGNGLVLKARKA